MSDMSRPHPFPPAVDHEQHDALLVAQYAAGDPLEADQQHQAQRLVEACGACAELATDLRAVSSAVAWEPLSPRRRDFRITPEQAERLEGNAFTRLLRGLSAPGSRALRPAAAGLLSVGLVFVVAGYAWPEGGSIEVAGEPNVAPAAVEERASGSPVPVEEPAAATRAPFEDLLRFQGGAPLEEGAASTMAPLDGLPQTLGDAAVEETEAFATQESADDAVAPSLSQKSSAKRAVDGDQESFDDRAEAVAGAAPEAPLVESAPDREVEAEVAEVPEPDLGLSEAPAPDLAASEVSAAADPVADEDESLVTAVPGSAGSSAESGMDAAREPVGEAEAAATAAAVEDTSVETLLLLVGLGLAITGAVLLLLMWLARRNADPLLR